MSARPVACVPPFVPAFHCPLLAGNQRRSNYSICSSLFLTDRHTRSVGDMVPPRECLSLIMLHYPPCVPCYVGVGSVINVGLFRAFLKIYSTCMPHVLNLVGPLYMILRSVGVSILYSQQNRWHYVCRCLCLKIR